MHEALDIEPADDQLRSRVLASIPMDQRRAGRSWKFSDQWAGGLVAGLLAIAVVAALLYTGSGRNTLHPTNSSPQLRLKAPEGIAVAPDGSVYVSDYAGDYVFRVEPNGSLVVVAGIGRIVYDPAAPRYAGPGGDGGKAIKADLANPSGLAVDGNGNLFVSDSYRSIVRRIDGQGVITTVVGGGPTSLNGGDGGPATAAVLQFPLGLAFDGTGTLYIGDTGDGKVRRVDTNGTITTLDPAALPGHTWAPGYLAVDPAGNLFVSERAPYPAIPAQRFGGGACRIFRVDKDGALAVVAGTGTCGFSGDGGRPLLPNSTTPTGLHLIRLGISTSPTRTIIGSAASIGTGSSPPSQELALPGSAVMVAPEPVLNSTIRSGSEWRVVTSSTSLMPTTIVCGF